MRGPPALPNTWQASCTLLRHFMRLASRGGRSLTSTKFRLLGGQITIRGLAPAPFFIFHNQIPETRSSSFRKISSFVHFPAARPKKVSGRGGCRPLWRGGWRDYSFGSSILSGTGCSTALASSRTTHRSKIVTIIPPFQNRISLPTTI
jgi:hypothetical protein